MKPLKASEDKSFQGNSTHMKESAKNPSVWREFKAMQIADSHENWNLNRGNHSKQTSIGNNGIKCTEFIFLLTGDLIFWTEMVRQYIRKEKGVETYTLR